MRDKNNIVSIVLVLCGLAVAPFLVANDYYLNILTQVLFSLSMPLASTSWSAWVD